MNKKRHLNEAWFDNEDLLHIRKRTDNLINTIEKQDCPYDPVLMFSDDTDDHEPIFRSCGLWCPRCRYISNNKISVCGEVYLTEEYFNKEPNLTDCAKALKEIGKL